MINLCSRCMIVDVSNIDTSTIDVSTNMTSNVTIIILTGGTRVPNTKETKVLLLLNELVVNIETTFGKCIGISQSRLEIMIQLFECGEISQSQLQKTLKIDSSAITRHLQQLELNGKIKRRKSESDNRITLVSLTDLGKEQMSGLWNEKIVFVKNMLEGFSEKEIDLTLDYLNRIQTNMNKINSDRESKGTS